MKRVFPFVLVAVVVLMSVALVTAFRSGLLAKVAELDWRDRPSDDVEIPVEV